MSKRKEKRQRFRNRQRLRAQRLREERQQTFDGRLAEMKAERILYLPLDIGKNVHWMRADDGRGQVVHPPHRLLTDVSGYAYWQQQVNSYWQSGQFDLLVIGHEPTGIYHENWCRHILHDFAPYEEEPASASVLYRLLNPYQVRLEREKLTLRLRKNDPLDLWAILQLLRQGQGAPARLPNPELTLLHQQALLAQRASRQLKASRIELLRQFDRLWPGALVNVKRFRRAHPDLPPPQPIVQSRPLERETFRCLLQHCPNPYQVRALGVKGLIDLFHQHEERCGPATAGRILACAQNALLAPPAIVEVYVQALGPLLADETHWQQRQQTAERCLESLVVATPGRHLLSIRGLTPLWAAYYLDLVGAPPRFDWADQVWAFVGFDPNLKQSGDSDPAKRRQISRRGDPFHRHLLTWMATLVAGHHPLFGQAFLQAERRGLGVWGAAIHTAHKLHRLCFRLLLDDRPFDDPTQPDDFARWRSYWLAYRQHRYAPQQHPHPGPWQPSF